jgi:hypothetical protein
LPDAIKAAVKESKPVLAWNVLPASWRSQGDGLLHEFAAAVPAPLYDQLMKTMQKFATVLTTKKQFVLNSVMVKAALADPNSPSMTQLTESYDAASDFISAVANSDLQSAEALSKATVADLLNEFGPQLMTAAKTFVTIAALQPNREGAEAKMVLVVLDSISNLNATVVSETGTSAVISVSLPSLPSAIAGKMAQLQSIPVTQVDGVWVVVPMAYAWPEGMAEAKHSIAEMKAQLSGNDSQSQQVMMMVQVALGMADTMLDSMAQANSQAEFDQAMANFGSLMEGMGS